MGKKGRKRVHDFIYSPMTGVQTDFLALLKKFVDSGSVRYEKFAEIWRASKMTLIFSGRQSDAEVREFTEKCFNIAKTFLFGASGFQTTVGGLYLLYALFSKQLFEPTVKIQKMMDVASKEYHYDVEYIFWKLRHSNAFHYVSCPTLQSGLQSFVNNSQEKAAQSYNRSGPESLLRDQGIICELTDSDAIDQLRAIHEQYQRVKCAMAGPDADEPQPSLSMIDSGIVEQMTKRIKQFESWKKRKINKSSGRSNADDAVVASDSGEDSDTDKETSSTAYTKNIGDIRAALKAKAMSFPSQSSRSRHYGATSLLCSMNKDLSKISESCETNQRSAKEVGISQTEKEKTPKRKKTKNTEERLLAEKSSDKTDSQVGKKAKKSETSTPIKSPKMSNESETEKSPQKAQRKRKTKKRNKNISDQTDLSGQSPVKRCKKDGSVDCRPEKLAAVDQVVTGDVEVTLDIAQTKSKGQGKRRSGRKQEKAAIKKKTLN
ncbi:hypothetical protein LSH36_161g10003 [Paralvinella palmiformis]|uniref:snRNA-activating protein complex subunit 1 n=1 Tax=Paralvinella palmiformis TaxID=53620 RepID=A0AAD9N6V0_9ANNE|nr:hypothetical protein LSH36_161g10003 [Paralvinella palmiformis]